MHVGLLQTVGVLRQLVELCSVCMLATFHVSAHVIIKLMQAFVYIREIKPKITVQQWNTIYIQIYAALYKLILNSVAHVSGIHYTPIIGSFMLYAVNKAMSVCECKKVYTQLYLYIFIQLYIIFTSIQSTCDYIYTHCIYIYIDIQACTVTYTYMYTYICKYACTYACMFTCKHVQVSMYICIYIYKQNLILTHVNNM